MTREWKYCPYCGDPIEVCECEGYNDERFPAGYAEIDYDNFDNAEAIDGARFDDMNYLRHFER